MPNERAGQPIRWDRGLLADAPQDPWVAPWNRKEQGGKRGEELFQLILSGIREIYDVNAVIAGGAVRDLAAGVTTHKDVDVFIPLDDKKFIEHYAELGWQGELVKQGKNTDYAKKKKTGGVGCFFPTTARFSSMVQNIGVDLVFMKEALTVADVATFPVYAQRGVWTLEEGRVLSPEAKLDIENKTFTIDPTITDKERVANVLAKVAGWKMRKDYCKWKVIEPEVKEWWEAKAAAEEDKKEAPKPAVLKNYKDFMDRWWHEIEAQAQVKVADVDNE